jgi:hypothetical protein
MLSRYGPRARLRTGSCSRDGRFLHATPESSKGLVLLPLRFARLAARRVMVGDLPRRCASYACLEALHEMPSVGSAPQKSGASPSSLQKFRLPPLRRTTSVANRFSVDGQVREMQITLLTLMLSLACGPAVSPAVKAETAEETPSHHLLVTKFGKLSGAEERLVVHCKKK